jgi:predicted DNA-binding transcriptional regulator AlpA
MTKQNTHATDNATIGPAEVAALLGLKVSTLANWRWSGCGPPFLRLGRKIRYRPSDLADWLAQRVQRPGR